MTSLRCIAFLSIDLVVLGKQPGQGGLEEYSFLQNTSLLFHFKKIADIDFNQHFSCF